MRIPVSRRNHKYRSRAPWHRFITKRGFIIPTSLLKPHVLHKLGTNNVEVIYYVKERRHDIDCDYEPENFICCSSMVAYIFYLIPGALRYSRVCEHCHCAVYNRYYVLAYRESPLLGEHEIVDSNRYLDNVYAFVSVYFPGGVDLIVMDYVSCWQTWSKKTRH